MIIDHMLPFDHTVTHTLTSDPETRARIVRAAVEDRVVHAALLPVVEAGLRDADVGQRAVALQLARALMARSLLEPVLDAFAAAPEAFLGVPDPEARAPGGGTLAQAVFAFVREARPRGHARAEAFLRQALSWPELRVEAFYAIGMDDGAVLRPHLVALLADRPDLAGPLGTQYALLHRGDALAACETLAAAPEAPRRVFWTALSRHLDRVHAIKLKVACRRALFGGP